MSEKKLREEIAVLRMMHELDRLAMRVAKRRFDDAVPSILSTVKDAETRGVLEVLVTAISANVWYANTDPAEVLEDAMAVQRGDEARGTT